MSQDLRVERRIPGDRCKSFPPVAHRSYPGRRCATAIKKLNFAMLPPITAVTAFAVFGMRIAAGGNRLAVLPGKAMDAFTLEER